MTPNLALPPLPTGGVHEPSLEPTELRLAGGQATLDGILRAIHQAARHRRPATPWTRLEVRHTSLRPLRLSDRDIQKRVQALLVERGMPDTKVSVHSISSRLEDVEGKHLLYLYGAPEAAASAAPAHPIARAWAAVASLWRGQAPDAAPRTDPEVNEDTGLSTAITAVEAAHLMTTALASASALHRQRQATQAVAEVEVIVRLPEAHAHLRAMVEQDPAAPRALARQLRSLGITVAEPLTLKCRFVAPSADAPTVVASEVDVEIKLSTTRSAAPPVPTPAPQPRFLEPTRVPVAKTTWGDPTSLPPAGPRVEMVVRGTQAQPFATPIRLSIGSFPATLDRATLADAGLAHLGNELPQAISNRAALRLELQAGRVVLHAPRRAMDGAAPLPLYYRRGPAGERGEALPERLVLGPQPLQLWLNDPRGEAGAGPVPWAEINLQT